MRFQGSVIKEQGITFGIVVVKQQILSNQQEANDLISRFGQAFGNIPVVLMAQDYRGRPSYFGRRDIAKFMASVPLSAIPWKEYTLN